MRQPTGYSQWFNEATAKAARDGWTSMMRNPVEHYLWYKPQGLSIVVAPEKPEGHVLATNERVRGDWTVEQTTRWVHDTCMRLPVLPGD